jgi:hypothetical protein
MNQGNLESSTNQNQPKGITMTDTNQENITVELEVQEYGLWAFCKRVQDAILDGYTFDLDTNKNAPTVYGTMFWCIMRKQVVPEVKVEPVVTKEPETPVTPSVPAVTRTRTKKAEASVTQDNPE